MDNNKKIIHQINVKKYFSIFYIEIRVITEGKEGSSTSVPRVNTPPNGSNNLSDPIVVHHQIIFKNVVTRCMHIILNYPLPYNIYNSFSFCLLLVYKAFVRYWCIEQMVEGPNTNGQKKAPPGYSQYPSLASP